MTTDEKLAAAIRTIKEEVAQLEQWADESVAGAWSTHQVGPQRNRAAQLARVALELERS